MEGRNKGVTHHSSSSVFPLTLAGDNAFVVLDFGKEVGGITTVQWGSVVQGSAKHAFLAVSAAVQDLSWHELLL